MPTQRSRSKYTGRRDDGAFILIPHRVMDSENWRNCSPIAIKMLVELVRQYNGRNNGDLSAGSKQMKRKGWKRGGTVLDACDELRHYGLIERTKVGGLRMGCHLYALTWHAIDYCGGKLECAPTNVGSGLWKITRPRFVKGRKKQKTSTESAPTNDGIRNERLSRAA